MFRTKNHSLPAELLEALIEEEKFAFVSRNLERCGYLRVIRETDETDGAMVLTVSFTLDGTRKWHSVDAVIDPAQAQAQDVKDAFRRLEDGIGAARIARLFGPVPRPVVDVAASGSGAEFP